MCLMSLLEMLLEEWDIMDKRKQSPHTTWHDSVPLHMNWRNSRVGLVVEASDLEVSSLTRSQVSKPPRNEVYSGDNWEFTHELSQELGVPRVPRSWSTPGHRRYNVLPILTETEQGRFDQISSTLEQGQFYSIKDVLRSKSFLRSFTLNSRKMEYSGGDNVEEKTEGNAAHVAADKAMTKKMDMKKLAHMATGRGEPKGATPTGPKGIAIGEKRGQDEAPTSRLRRRANRRWMPKRRGPCRRLTTRRRAPREGTSANPGFVQGLEASAMENPAVAENLLQRFILPADKKEVDKMDLDMAIDSFTPSVRAVKVAKELEGRVAKLEAKKQHATKELRRLKERDADLERHEKEMAELREKEALAKTSTIEEFKSLYDYKDAVEKIASSYFSERFDLCKNRSDSISIPTSTSKTSRSTPTWLRRMKRRRRTSWTTTLPSIFAHLDTLPSSERRSRLSLSSASLFSLSKFIVLKLGNPISSGRKNLVDRYWICCAWSLSDGSSPSLRYAMMSSIHVRTLVSTKATMKEMQMVEEEREVLEDVGRTPEAKVVEDLMRYDLDERSSDRFFLTDLEQRSIYFVNKMFMDYQKRCVASPHSEVTTKYNEETANKHYQVPSSKLLHMTSAKIDPAHAN
ncbi:hypothetical protein Acr_00g0031400 [Actinidia rufa]|uniref:Uncharacterized protein n=1 Tax=Actinidia rufa TaxID=165716 RepID=A0A7J0DFB6_9ERIC|nr:hypothetical protein Acr_00g0031400 [Actinidia rufa]